MRRLRDTDGTSTHRRHARYHMSKCKGAGTLHEQLRTEMTAKYTALRDGARASEDAEDASVDSMADRDRAEIRLENAIRDIDGEAAKIDRGDATVNAQKTIFPQGFGAEIDPEGEDQLKVLPALYTRLTPLASKGEMGTAITELQQAEAGLRAALLADAGADEEVARRFAAEVAARMAIREQLESAHGRLRDVYKSRPALAEQFFLNEGSSRGASKKASAPKAKADEGKKDEGKAAPEDKKDEGKKDEK